MTTLVLGLDSGGTKTVAAVANQSGTIVALKYGDGLDPTAGDGWEGRLALLLKSLPKVAVAVLGLPFHGEMVAVSARQTEVVQDLLGPGALVMNDVAVAFEAALAGGEGVLILAGTGSMAWARGPKGTARCGGWGDAFGDEGSAYWIGREALALVSRHLDGRAACAAFADGLLARLGIGPGELIAFAYSGANPRATIASTARHVSALAQSGNGEALGLMRQAAIHLAQLGQAAARGCGAMPPLPWSFAGGVFDDPTLREAVTLHMGTAPIAPRLPPVGGAILVAANRAGWQANAGFIDRLNTSLLENLTQMSIQPQEVTS